MKIYPSPNDIQQMKHNGYDPLTIAEAEATLSLWQEMEDIQNQIKNAFADVLLGEGVGLWEAQGLDDYKSSAECFILRQRDEKLDWSKISVQDLNNCNSSLSFFDAEGMRFHLPAFLIADLKGQWMFDLTFHLCEVDNPSDKFSLLNDIQRDAVRAYLSWIATDIDYSFDRDSIVKNLVNGYWAIND